MAPNQGTTHIQFRTGDIEDALQLRSHMEDGHMSFTAREILKRYFDLMERELRTVNLTRKEACAICDVCNGWAMDPHSIMFMWAEVSDGISLNQIDKKWGVDGPALVAKIRAWTPGQTLAVADAVEKFWHDPNPTDEALARAGFKFSDLPSAGDVFHLDAV